MEKRYIIGIDQSTQGTKALLFDGEGHLLRRTDLPHRQIVNEKGWVSHDLNEIYRNTVQTVKTLVAESGVAPEEIAGIGISNQRETTAVWDRVTGEPLEDAIVWQCGRASGIAQEIAEQGYAEQIREATGLQLSAYFPAAKMAWLLRNGGEERQKRAENGELFVLREMGRELAVWVVQHTQLMDAALALHLRRVGYNPLTGEVASPDNLPDELIHGCGGACSSGESDEEVVREVEDEEAPAAAMH